MHAIATPLPEYKEPAPRRRTPKRAANSDATNAATNGVPAAVTADPEKAALLKQLGLDEPMQIVSEAELNAEEFYEAQSDGAELALSRAQQVLLKRRKQREEKGEKFITRFDFDDVTLWTKRLAYVELVSVGMLTGRDGNGQLDLTNLDVLGSFTASMMFAACVCGEDDDTPFFESVEDAQLYVDEPGNGALVYAIFNAITDQNMELLTQLALLSKKTATATPTP